MENLVTGASGFTGRALVKKLLQRGESVKALVRETSDYADIEKEGAEIIVGNVKDKASVEKAVSGVDRVYHIAALFREAGFPDEEYYAVNLEGTRNLLEASVEAGVERFVHCSTIGVCGDIKDPPADEKMAYNPGDIYQVTKMEGEKLALSYASEGKLKVTVARPASIYGPGDLRLLKMFKMINKGRFVVLGSGKPFFHVVYIDDLVDGFILCAQNDKSIGEVFIIAGDEYVELNELFEIIAGKLGVKPPKLHLPAWPFQWLGTLMEKICIPLGLEPPIYRRRVDFFTKSRSFSIEKAKTILGYQPKVDLRQGIENTVNWYRKNNLL
jgi:nucleoside-diphosphate-sugar epimerase